MDQLPRACDSISPREAVKRREIAFKLSHPDPEQAQTAVELLRDIEGVQTVNLKDPQRIELEYDLRVICLEQIEDALRHVGFKLDNSLYYRLLRALFYHTEECQRANWGCGQSGPSCPREAFVNRYQRIRHAKDERPEHWRHYL